MEITVGITGASGAVYAHRTLVHLAASRAVERINLILSDSARTVAMVVLGFDLRSADEKRINEWIGLPQCLEAGYRPPLRYERKGGSSPPLNKHDS